MSLKNTISRLAESFASEILAALRTASLDDLTALAGGGGGGGAAAGARRRPGRPAKAAAAPAAATKVPRVKKGGRRSAGDIEKVAAAIVGAVKGAKAGLRSEQIQKALGLSKKDTQRPIAWALEKKLLRKTGEKRGTTYFAK
ncbi:MAG: hypothetical protein ACXVEF_04795 [Polyangiales bacterium]